MPQYIVRKGRYGHEIAKFDDSNTSPGGEYTSQVKLRVGSE